MTQGVKGFLVCQHFVLECQSKSWLAVPLVIQLQLSAHAFCEAVDYSSDAWTLAIHGETMVEFLVPGCYGN